METKSLPKILYVDDTPDARLLGLRLLAHKNQVFEASDALSGLELALKTQPNLVLLDINLPQFGGREVAARLTTLLPNTPLVAFSAETSASARDQAVAACCVSYLPKPLDASRRSRAGGRLPGGCASRWPGGEGRARHAAGTTQLTSAAGGYPARPGRQCRDQRDGGGDRRRECGADDHIPVNRG